MKQYFLFEGELMGELSASLKTDIVSKGYEMADFELLDRPEIVTDTEYDLMKAAGDLYDSLLDIVEALKRNQEVSADTVENAIAAIKKADVMSAESLAAIIEPESV